ncbi:MAG TPA: spermidine/putrescine ABC transporter substrate-binding protein [Candidatus Dependentiae bacterium]|nr:spermidine/putrescine ABC transporter substrate-binding protein [Candidatus Dependentiae bacterium]HRQ62702.1 spermidine/putrescine ABC transporter substrate-binding protein [Candidatus Dependentiae bacterium]
MNRTIMRWIIRICMIIVVLSGIALFLYAPSFIRRWYPEKSINILVWPTEIDAQYLTEFEQKTGIKVNINYIETNEELFIKMRAAQGSGYDLIMLSDHIVKLMIKEGLLTQLDKSRLSFFNQFYPALLGHYFDPHNTYTIPYFWDVYGLGINTTYYGGYLPEVSWNLVFDKNKVHDKVGMLEDRREIILIATKYLCGDIMKLRDPDCMQAVKKLLREQKEWVAAYTDMRVSYLLGSETVPVSIAVMSDVLRLNELHPEIVFRVPEEGGFAIIDSFAIPRGSNKQEYVYEFLNYLYTPRILEKYLNKYDLYSPIVGIKLKGVKQAAVIPTQKMFKNLDFYHSVVEEKIFDQMWIDIIS